MKSDDTAIPSIPEIKIISPLSTPRGILFLNDKKISAFCIAYFCINFYKLCALRL